MIFLTLLILTYLMYNSHVYKFLPITSIMDYKLIIILHVCFLYYLVCILALYSALIWISGVCAI